MTLHYRTTTMLVLLTIFSTAYSQETATTCNFLHSTSCEDCTHNPGCAWCLSTSKCANDAKDQCQGAADHVGKLQGVTGTCKGPGPAPTQQQQQQMQQQQQQQPKQECKFKHLTSCKDCTRRQGCAWCLKAGKCVDDNQDGCEGADDHVGRLEQSHGRCDGTSSRPRNEPTQGGPQGQQNSQQNSGPPTACDTSPKAQESCESCLSLDKCAWCSDENKCVSDRQGLCKGPDVHIGTLGSKKKCPSRADKLSANVGQMLGVAAEL